MQIAVSDIQHPVDRIQCGMEIGGVHCRPVTLANGVTLEVGKGEGGAYDVVYRRADGVTVHVMANPLFGNSSLVPVEGMAIDRHAVYRLVQDERLQMPES